MLKDYGLRLTYMQAWRAKERTLELVRDNPAQSYAKLPSYFHILEATYPGSHVRLHKSEDGHFLYAFVALVASIKGWEYCRPIVVVDGTFLEAAYKGTMLTANTLDAGGSILPLAYAVVDSENDASWRWFFEQFREAFGQRAEMCVVSDRHASIIKATSIVYDGVPHFACMWHLLQNVIKNFRKSQDRIIGLFYSMAKAYTMLDFNKHMTVVEKIDKRVKEYLLDIGYSKWSRVHAQVNRTWIMTSTIAESVNSRTRHAKVLTVLQLLEFMRQLVQKWNNANRSNATFSAFPLGTKYHNILKCNIAASEKLKVRESNEYVYTVLDGITHFTVYLQQRTCSCGRFQLDDLPCPHALAVLTTKHIGFEEYCSAYYTRKNWLLTYQFHIEPLPDESTWNIPPYVSQEVVLPPIGKRAPGRPKISRNKTMREDGFKKSKITCSNCGQPGHNRSTCKNVRPYKK